MKTSTLPAVRVEPALRSDAEAVEVRGDVVRIGAIRHQLEQDFH